MTGKTCPRESELAKALPAGDLDPSLREHVRSCRSCTDHVEAFRFTQAWGALPTREARLPDPLWIRLRAAARAREEAGRRTMKPVVISEAVAVVVAVLCALVGIIWKWSAIKNLVVAPLLALPAEQVPAAGLFVVLFGILLLIPPLVLHLRLPAVK
jgi:hypothetical protein